MITGVLAIPLLVLVTRRRSNPLALWTWNMFGTLDLVLALALGALSFNGGGALIPLAVGGEEIQALPWALIPTVLVPAYLVIHGIIFAQLTVVSRRGGQMAAAVA